MLFTDRQGHRETERERETDGQLDEEAVRHVMMGLLY